MDPLNNPDITYFARTNFRGTDKIFGIKRKDRRQHVYVLGKSGTGKSVLLENLIIQNIRQGEGVCVVDPHGELVEKIMEMIPPERAGDVIYFNPADMEHNIGFNPFQLDDPKYRDLVAAGLMGIFTKIWANAWSSRMEYILQNCILALLDVEGSTLLGIPRLLVDKDYRQYVINNIKDPVIKNFWIHEYEAWRDQFRNEAIQPIQNKVGQFLSSAMVRNIVGQSKSTINIFDIMNDQKIFLVNVSKGRIGEDNSALLGGMLITKIQLAAMERVRIPEAERKDFYLFIDEFQNFSTESFGSILSEARKYRLCLTIAHQYTAQLDETVRDAVFGNVGTMIIFRVGAEDADTISKEFEPEFDTEDFVNLPNYHVYLKLMVDGITSRPFSAKTLPPIVNDTSPEVKQHIIDTSRKLYTHPRTQVEDEINRWSTSVPGQTNEEGVASEGKFRVECANDKKVIYVPFEPDPNRPVYCRECLLKIKNGELEPLPGFRPPKEKRETSVSYDALATLGIEYTQHSRESRSYRPQPVYGERIQDKKAQEATFNRNQHQQQPIRPRIERKAPDKEGLQSIIKNALTSVGVGDKPIPIVDKKPIPPEEKQPPKTVSLGALTKRPPISQQTANIEAKVPSKVDKSASDAHLSSLRDAIAQATKKEAMPEVKQSTLVEPQESKTSNTKETELPAPKKREQETREVPEDVLRSIIEGK